jgi:hypothetical protein
MQKGPKKSPSSTSSHMSEDQRRTLSMLSPIASVDPRIIVPRTKLPDELYAEITPGEPVKIFVSGQRGMGKTTELKRFLEMVDRSTFIPIFLQFGSQQSISHTGLVRAMAAGLYGTQGLKVDDRAYQKIQDWFASEESTTTIEESSGGKASVGGNYLVIGASGEIAHSHTKSTKKTNTLERSITELLGAFNSFIEKMERSSKRKVLFVVDDIDKVQNVDSINSTFIHSSHIIGQLQCACIFTVPITYATSNYVRIAGLPYNGIHRVPAIDLFDEKGSRNLEAQQFMRHVFNLRMPYSPLSQELVDQVLDNSGGVLIDAMRMLRGLCKSAIISSGFVANESAVEQEFQHLVDDYQFVIDSRALWDALAEMCSQGTKRGAIGEGLLPDLLHKMIAIEYKGKRSWFAPHPAARRLYQQNSEV